MSASAPAPSLLRRPAAPFWWVALAAIAAFLPILRNEFTYDDLDVIVGNTLLPQLLRPSTYFSDLYYAVSGETTYRPLVSLTYGLEHLLWGKSPVGYHAVNLLFHAVASLLFVAVCFTLGASRAAALAAGLLYAVHPLGAEATCSIGFREDLLCALFYFAAFALWPPFATEPAPPAPPPPQPQARPPKRRGGRPRRAAPPAEALAPALRLPRAERFALALVAFGLALLSKEMALSFPLLVLAKDWRASRRLAGQGSGGWRGRLVWHGGAWGLAAAALVVFLTFHDPNAGFSVTDDAGLARRLAGFPTTVLRYLALFVVPYPLSADRVIDLRAAWVWPAAAGSVALLAVAGSLCFRRRAAFAPAWEAFVAFFLLLGPVSNLIRIDHPMAERYLALPLGALCWLAGEGLVRALAPPPRRTAIGAILAVFVLLTWWRCAEWRTKLSLWGAEVRRGSQSAKAYGNLGAALMGERRWVEAEGHLRQAVALQATYAEGLYHLGVTEKELGRSTEAEPYVRKAIEVRPEYALAHATLANLLAERGDREAALRECALALRYGAHNATAHNIAGIAQMLLGNAEEGERLFRAAAAMDPTLPQAFENLGQALGGRNRFDEALACYRKALSLQPNSPSALEGLGTALASAGRTNEAVDCFRRWVGLEPGEPRAYFCLGRAFLQAGRRDDARGVLEQGLALARQAGNAPVAEALQQALGECR